MLFLSQNITGSRLKYNSLYGFRLDFLLCYVSDGFSYFSDYNLARLPFHVSANTVFLNMCKPK